MGGCGQPDCRRESCGGAEQGLSRDMSSMERECLYEKRRSAKLIECKEMLRRDGTQKYNRDAFKTLFTNEVRIHHHREPYFIRLVFAKLILSFAWRPETSVILIIQQNVGTHNV
ncbi:hypothetical protein QAD02_017344 [Eretmocerus hayati]|uniref:Uncharacterized protein n=1 Tax=Eretmocerus hayati TaxID=131215 RepID=A0ACC2PGJ2_9HYME|nr:hypothetical protein QAD02_017344 [Eretmocerus hayati]